MGYIAGLDRNQSVLFPETLDEYVAADNAVRFIDAFVATLDMAKLGFARAIPGIDGHPAYDPRDLLRLFIYGYLNRTRSSRKLEVETHRNLEVIWLMRKLRPDHKTIATFRRAHPEPLKQVTREFTVLCKELNLFGSSLVFIDGSKFRAVNNKDRNFTQARLEKLQALADERLAEYMKELEEADAAEEGEAGATEAGLRAKIEALQYYANWEACAGCPMREQCTTAKQGRRIMRTPEEERVAAMAQRLKERSELMLQRKSTVEHPFGTMKRTWDGGYFLMKGLRNVRGELSLAVLAYNIRRVLNLLGVECVLEVLRKRKMAPQPLARAA